MAKPLWLTDHVRFRMRLRRISRGVVARVLHRPVARYHDTLTGNQVAVGRATYAGKARLMVVIYQELPGAVCVVTVHPIRPAQHRLRVKRGRWQRP